MATKYFPKKYGKILDKSMVPWYNIKKEQRRLKI
jgi:hypothetical protein